MNTTKLLCRVFDRRKKGYVEWGDVFDVVPIIIIAAIATSMYLYGGYSMATVYYDFIDDAPVSVLGIVQGLCATWFVIASAMLSGIFSNC